MNDVMEDVRAVIESSCDRPVVVMGMSKSGPVAIDLAINYPHLVERLILIASALPMEPRSRAFGGGGNGWN